jgi:hypothetical protein
LGKAALTPGAARDRSHVYSVFGFVHSLLLAPLVCSMTRSPCSLLLAPGPGLLAPFVLHDLTLSRLTHIPRFALPPPTHPPLPFSAPAPIPSPSCFDYPPFPVSSSLLLSTSPRSPRHRGPAIAREGPEAWVSMAQGRDVLVRGEGTSETRYAMPCTALALAKYSSHTCAAPWPRTPHPRCRTTAGKSGVRCRAP